MFRGDESATNAFDDVRVFAFLSTSYLLTTTTTTGMAIFTDGLYMTISADDRMTISAVDQMTFFTEDECHGRDPLRTIVLPWLAFGPAALGTIRRRCCTRTDCCGVVGRSTAIGRAKIGPRCGFTTSRCSRTSPNRRWDARVTWPSPRRLRPRCSPAYRPPMAEHRFRNTELGVQVAALLAEADALRDVALAMIP